MTLDQRQALVTAAATTLAVLIAFSFHLTNPWWAGISAFIVSQSSTDGLLRKAAYRLAGTIAGCLIAAFLAVQLAGNPIQQTIVTIGLFSLGVYKRHTARYSYAWLLGCLTAVLFLTISTSEPDDVFADIFYRALEISTGVTVAAIVGLAAAPFLHGDRPPPPDAPAVTERDARILALQVGIFGGVVLVVAIAILNALAFPAVAQVVVSLAVMLSTSIEVTRNTARRRVTGCVLGGLTGVILVALGTENLLLWSWLFFGGVALFAVHHHSDSPDAYVGTQAAIAFIVACVTGPSPVTDIAAAAHRIAGITVTAAIVGVLSAAVVPWVTPRRPRRERAAPPAHHATE